jgi:hypothetical protein
LTRQQIRDLSRKRLGETTASFWTDAELNTWIDDAGEDLAFKTKSIRANGYLTVIEDQAEYTVNSNFPNLLSILEVYHYQNSKWRRLTATTRNELELQNQVWRSVDSGTPDRYYWDREEDLFGLYIPPDSDSAGTNYIRVYYTRTYTTLATDASVPTLPDFLHRAMSDYIVATGFETRGYGDKANDAWGKYLRRIQEYLVERRREKEDEELIMRSYRNV